MKMTMKAFCLLLALLLLASCATTGKAGLTAEQVMKINTAEKLLKSHEAVSYAQLDWISGDTIHMDFFKDDLGQVCMAEDDNGYEGFLSDAMSFSRSEDGTSYLIIGYQDPSISEYLFMVRGSEFVLQTKLPSGDILCRTEAPIDEGFAAYLSGWSVTTEDRMLTDVVVDSTSLEVKSCEFFVQHPDGSTMKLASAVILYDKELCMPSVVAEHLASSLVDISIHMPSGSIRVARIPQGQAFNWVNDEGFGFFHDASGERAVPDDAILTADEPISLYVLPRTI